MSDAGAPARPVIPDVLADRYASSAMLQIWSPEGRVMAERELWVAVLRAQVQLGMKVAVPAGAVETYEAAIDQVDLESIRQIELRTKHDVMARIQEFNRVAGMEGHELIHLGMTSRDATENVEQMLVRKSLELVRERMIAVLFALARQVEAYRLHPLTGRSHNVAAQVTTVGKRFAMWGEEMLLAFGHLEEFINRYPLRGIKGPMGTCQDQLDLFEGNEVKVDQLDVMIAEHLGFDKVMVNVGQIYPRSLDYEMAALLAQAGSAPGNAAQTFRLMSGFELMNEAGTDRKGSSAMPHKVNARTCERICSLNAVLGGYVAMLDHLRANQWQEGDVQCSVVRRVALPGCFFALDGMFQAFLHVLQEMELFPEVINRELSYYLPYLATTKILMAAVEAGMGREQAHEIIGKHAKAVLVAQRNGQVDQNVLFEQLAGDPEFPLTLEQLQRLGGNPMDFIGDAEGQVMVFLNRVFNGLRAYENAANYKPEPLL